MARIFDDNFSRAGRAILAGQAILAGLAIAAALMTCWHIAIDWSVIRSPSKIGRGGGV